MNCTKKKGIVVLEKLSLDNEELQDSIEDNNGDDYDVSPADLPSFKSVIFKKKSSADDKLFYDSEQCKWVEVDNFAFSDHANHFENNSDNSSSLALLDSNILDETSNVDDSKIIVDELKRNLEEITTTTTTESSQPNSLDVSFDNVIGDARPKIKSPRYGFH